LKLLQLVKAQFDIMGVPQDTVNGPRRDIPGRGTRTKGLRPSNQILSEEGTLLLLARQTNLAGVRTEFHRQTDEVSCPEHTDTETKTSYRLLEQFCSFPPWPEG
jgi:hypothetical protein